MWFSNEAFCQASQNLELMIYGGEVLTETLLRQAQTASHEAAQVNMYGPTEGTVYNTTRPADYRSYVNIGWPMRNNRLYVLDESFAGRKTRPYFEVFRDLGELPPGRILLDTASVSYTLVRRLLPQVAIIDAPDPLEAMKAVKKI